ISNNINAQSFTKSWGVSISFQQYSNQNVSYGYFYAKIGRSSPKRDKKANKRQALCKRSTKPLILRRISEGSFVNLFYRVDLKLGIVTGFAQERKKRMSSLSRPHKRWRCADRIRCNL